jgi:hypothetical protein
LALHSEDVHMGKITMTTARLAFLSALIGMAPANAWAQDSDIQQKLSNPIASLTIIPLQLNYDTGIGPAEDGDRWTLNVQPVIPFKLDQEWTLVVRTIIPIIKQDDIFPGAEDQFGLGDSLQSFFFVPQTVNGFTFGFGPALQYRTGTDDLLTTGKWGAGPTAVALQQSGPWTVGILANHIWSFAGDEDRADVSNTFLQPFLAYAASGGWTFSLNTQSSYDWVSEQWSVPINFTVSKLTKFGDQPVSIAAGPKYWAESPDSGPHGWGATATLTFILP